MHADQKTAAPMALRLFFASIRVHLRVSAAIISCDRSFLVSARGRAVINRKSFVGIAGYAASVGLYCK